MTNVKELTKWLKKSSKFLTENTEYVGVWKKLNDIFCVVVLWEEGWGDEKRDDVIQFKDDYDWGLCVGIKIYNPADSVDMWVYPWDKETGELLTESTGISPKEDYERLSSWVLNEFENIEGLTPNDDGSISIMDEPPTKLAQTIKPEDVEEPESEEEFVDIKPEKKLHKEVEEGIINPEAQEFSQEDLNTLEQSIYEHLNENGIFPQDGTIGKASNSLVDLTLKLIIDGDWKHDHLATEDLVKQWCDAHGLVIVKHESEETRESESDWYEAIHTWNLMVDTKEKKGKELVLGFQNMFKPLTGDDEEE